MKQTSFNEIALSGVLLAFAGTFMFSLKPIVVKYAYSAGLSSEQVISLRMLFSMPFYIGVLIFYWLRNADKRKIYIQQLLPVAVLGMIGYFIASYLNLLGLQYISAQLERVVLFCFPTIVVLLSYFFFKTQLPKNIWLILGMSYAGIILIFVHDLSVLGEEVAKGTALVFASAVCFAVYVMWSKTIITKIGSQFFTSVAMLSASLGIYVFFMASDAVESLSVSYEGYLFVAILAFFCTVIPSLLTAEAIHRIGPERTSIIGTSGPALTSIFAVFLLSEAFTIYHGAGLGLIMLAVGIMMKKPKKLPPAP